MKKLLTEDEILDLYMQTYSDILEVEVTNEDTVAFFKALSKIPATNTYLRNTMGKDIQRYFIAEDDLSRARIKGAYGRTMYFRAMLKKVREMDEAVKEKNKRVEIVA